jgi:hypothetical protein
VKTRSAPLTCTPPDDGEIGAAGLHVVQIAHGLVVAALHRLGGGVAVEAVARDVAGVIDDDAGHHGQRHGVARPHQAVDERIGMGERGRERRGVDGAGRRIGAVGELDQLLLAVARDEVGLGGVGHVRIEDRGPSGPLVGYLAGFLPPLGSGSRSTISAAW